MRGLRIYGTLGTTFHTPVLQLVWQTVAVLRIVANNVLPLVASIASDRVAIVFVEAADAVYLAIVLLFDVVRKLLLVCEMCVIVGAGDTA